MVRYPRLALSAHCAGVGRRRPASRAGGQRRQNRPAEGTAQHDLVTMVIGSGSPNNRDDPPGERAAPLSIGEAAARSGLPARTIQRAIQSGALPVHEAKGRTGREYVIDPEDLTRFLAAQAGVRPATQAPPAGLVDGSAPATVAPRRQTIGTSGPAEARQPGPAAAGPSELPRHSSEAAKPSEPRQRTTGPLEALRHRVDATGPTDARQHGIAPVGPGALRQRLHAAATPLADRQTAYTDVSKLSTRTRSRWRRATAILLALLAGCALLIVGLNVAFQQPGPRARPQVTPTAGPRSTPGVRGVQPAKTHRHKILSPPAGATTSSTTFTLATPSPALLRAQAAVDRWHKAVDREVAPCLAIYRSIRQHLRQIFAGSVDLGALKTEAAQQRAACNGIAIPPLPRTMGADATARSAIQSLQTALRSGQDGTANLSDIAAGNTNAAVTKQAMDTLDRALANYAGYRRLVSTLLRSYGLSA